MSPTARSTPRRDGPRGAGQDSAAARPTPEVDHEAPRPQLVEPWPHGVSREPSMRISDVLTELGGDFPTLTPSKLRFLEEHGLVEPRRTPGGYRQYSRADVERLRYVLRQQRDSYLPLKVIGDQLDALDRGQVAEPLTPRLATTDGERTGAALAGRVSVRAVAEAAHVEPAFVAELVEAGVLTAGPTGHLDPWAYDVVLAAAALAEHGVEARHLRSFRAAADRQVSVVEQIISPLRGHRTGAVQSHQAHAASVAAEVGELCGTLHTALVRAGVAGLTS